MQKAFWDNFDSFYFIGIGGTSMSGLAKFMLAAGKTVAGSDVSQSIYTEELKKSGIDVDFAGDGKSIKNYDVIVYTDAVRLDDCRLVEAEKHHKTIISRGKLLYEVSRAFEKVIAVSGCHGKTTCTAMLAHIFFQAGIKFGVHAGGRDIKFGNFYMNGNEYFITEACEYKKNFLLLKPNIALVLNDDPDHLECYGSAENLREAYKKFINCADTAVTRYGDFDFNLSTFWLDKGAKYHAENLQCNGGKYSFTAYKEGERLGDIKLCVYGKHNVYNAVAALAVASIAGITFEDIAAGIFSFKGVERRFEHIGTVNGVEYIADYAHHPQEIEAVLDTARQISNKNIYVIFQPHTYSRTKNLFGDFVKVLSGVDNLLIYRTFAAREYFDDEGSALTLSQGISGSHYGDCPRDISDFTQFAANGDVVLFLGAGDIYDIAKDVVKGKIK